MKYLTTIFLFLAISASAHALTFTAQGDFQVDTAQSKFGGASGLGDGTGDWLKIDFDAGNSEVWDLTADFTISLWVRFAAEGTFGLAASTNGTEGFQYYVVTNGATPSLHVWTGAGTDRSNAWNPGIDTWYHVALTRSGTTVTMFIDGTSIGTVADGDFDRDGSGLSFGIANAQGDVTNAPLNGWMDDFSIQNGTARWTANFTPPTSADCDLTNGTLIVHFDGTDASTTFTDDSGTACPAAAADTGFEHIDVIGE